MDALESERAKLEAEIKSAKEALNMSKKNEIKLDAEAVILAALRGADDGIEEAVESALDELTDQMRERAPTLPDDPWEAIAAVLGAYVTADARGNQDPIAAYDAARAALRTLPSFGEMSARVGRELRREPTYDDSIVIVTTLDAISHGLVEALRLPADPDQKPIGIPDPPPPPPPPTLATRAHLDHDVGSLDARHSITQHADDVIVEESWYDARGDVTKRYSVRLQLVSVVHLVLNTTPEERTAIEARIDWRGVDCEGGSES